MENLHHAFLFDSWRWREHCELQGLYDRMWDDLPKTGSKPKTLESMRHHLKLFLCNLYVSYYYRKPVAISIMAVKFTHGRYKALHLKRIPFMAIYGYLKSAGWIGFQPGYRPFCRDDEEREFVGSVTRIWASEKLERVFSECGDFLPEREGHDCIILRDLDKKDIRFEENAFTTRLRFELESVNRVFSSHYFIYNAANIYSEVIRNPYYRGDDSNSHLASTNNSIPSLREPNEFFRRFCPRIKAVFSRGDFSCGGRLYSDGIGDWQAMPQAQRGTIRIDNCRTVELDFHSFHISMLYAVEGRQITGDPYNAVAPKALRPVVKKLLLTVLNASSIGEAASAMRQQIIVLRNKPFLKERDLTFLRAYYRYHPDWIVLIERLINAHPVIRSYFCTGAGLFLQRLDSEIMRNVLSKLAARNIPCLPVHDSAIVQYFREWDLRREMNNAYRGMFPGFWCGIEKKCA